MTRRKRNRQQTWLMSLNQTGTTMSGHLTITAAANPNGFTARLVPEGEWSSDGRMFAKDSISVREVDGNLPLMGLIENTEAHDRAINVGHFTSVTRGQDGWWTGEGVWADTPEAVQIRAAVRSGDVTGISVDAAVTEMDYLSDAETYDEMMAMFDEDEQAEETDEPERVTIGDREYIVSPVVPDRMRATVAELMGATIVPFPAFAGASITDLGSDEPSTPEAEVVEPEPVPDAVVAAAAPVAPPSDWFRLPADRVGAYDVEIDDNGRIHGYPAATWDSCHIAFPDECVTPPSSECDYAYFKVGSVRCSDGKRVATGPLTLRGGHADRTWTAARAMAFYDDTDSAFADVNIGEDEYGIWIAGALRPDTTPEQVRIAMASGFSGDWRMIGGRHELIALSAVNTPGFRHHASLYEQHGMVASMILDMPRGGRHVEDNDAVLASATARIARSIGRSVDQRIEALQARVHPEVHCAL